MTPACAQACPTESIQFGPLEELRRAGRRAARAGRRGGNAGARLYGEDPDDGVGGFGAFFLLLDEPEVYGLPAAPVAATRDLPSMWRAAAAAGAGRWSGAVALAFARRPAMRASARLEQGYYGRPILKPHVWKPVIAVPTSRWAAWPARRRCWPLRPISPGTGGWRARRPSPRPPRSRRARRC